LKIQNFPQVMTGQKVMIEFTDAVIHAKDLVNFTIQADDNIERSKKTNHQLLRQKALQEK